MIEVNWYHQGKWGTVTLPRVPCVGERVELDRLLKIVYDVIYYRPIGCDFYLAKIYLK